MVKLNADTETGHYFRAFTGGECAMAEGSTGGYGSAFEALGDKVAISMAPMYDGNERRNTYIGGASIWVMKGHDDDRDRSRQGVPRLRPPERAADRLHPRPPATCL